jgi:hypothetical protein
MKKLPRFTIGMGDRFAHQGEAQLSAVQSAAGRGVPLHPVCNKSNRAHTLIGTKPEDLRAEADAAVKALNWTDPYFVDADHINLHTVDGFHAASDFFTLDVADYSGKSASPESMAAFLEKRSGLVGTHRLPLFDAPLEITRADLEHTAGKFLWAMQEAGLHLKTAGTTWLEEVAGLAEAGGEGLAIAKEIYAAALPHAEELIKPYAPVVDITIAELPFVETVNSWSSEDFVAALNHDASCLQYTLQFHQFIHVSFKR